MHKLVKYIAVVLIFTSFLACDMFEPIDENRISSDYIGHDPESAEGILLHGYQGLINQYSFLDVATDDAVTNQLNSGYKRMATGELNAQFTPVYRWDKYEQIFYLNKFIEILDAGNVRWKLDNDINTLFNERLRGEALALRGAHHFYILEAYAGIGTSGELLGIPYFDEFVPSYGDFNVPRLTFAETVEKINADFDAALALLPMDYSDDESKVLPRYKQYDFGKYKVVNGSQYNLRMSGRIVKALKARLALYAASPAFLNDPDYYEKAANVAGELLNEIGGVSGMPQDGGEYYLNPSPDNDREFIWRGNMNWNSSWLEANHFPPSENGKGQLNPSQNLVEAFPMANGYPAIEANGYNPQKPYQNRDPRLSKYIYYNGSDIHDKVIKTGVGGGADRLDSIAELSTTTGYYMKKLLHPGVRINNDGSTIDQQHVDVYFRYTELFLIFAEATNEVGGPDHKVNGMSARDVIAAIRKRAGIEQPDSYLASINGKETMRELIRNERRLELCFEGFRFWDIRRWGLPLNETAKGYFWDGSKYDEIPTVEKRVFSENARYMPLPYGEVLKFDNLEQNKGW